MCGSKNVKVLQLPFSSYVTTCSCLLL